MALLQVKHGPVQLVDLNYAIVIIENNLYDDFSVLFYFQSNSCMSFTKNAMGQSG